MKIICYDYSIINKGVISIKYFSYNSLETKK